MSLAERIRTPINYYSDLLTIDYNVIPDIINDIDPKTDLSKRAKIYSRREKMIQSKMNYIKISYEKRKEQNEQRKLKIINEEISRRLKSLVKKNLY